MNERLAEVLRAPHVSEKSTRLQEHDQYVFLVAPGATKADVKAAVEDHFNVKVRAVNLVNVGGKSRSFRFRAGKRSAKRKAYVTLAAGQTIELMGKA